MARGSPFVVAYERATKGAGHPLAMARPVRWNMILSPGGVGPLFRRVPSISRAAEIASDFRMGVPLQKFSASTKIHFNGRLLP
jgi:hypothetical protein